MKLLPFEGFMIPGISFVDCCIWVLSWSDNPTPYKKMTEVWVLRYNGQRTCYIAPGEAESVLCKYHNFDEIVPANIDISETGNSVEIRVATDGENVMALGLRHKPTLKYGILNWLISHSNPERFGTKGKTETGMLFHNLPKKLVPLSVEKAELNGTCLKSIAKPKPGLAIGDGKPSDVPLIVYCTHLLEEYTL